VRHLGSFTTQKTVRFIWNTFSGGASITRSTDGSIRVYKNGSSTQRSSASGITDTEDFDGLTGLHLCEIDLTNNADAFFYEAGSYSVVLEGATVGGSAVNVCLAHFDIGAFGDDDPIPAPPAVGTSDLHVFVYLKTVSGDEYAFAEQPLNDDPDWYAGRKPGKLIDISSFSRSLSRDGAFEVTRCTVTLGDVDRQFRTLVEVTPLRGAYMAIYIVPDTVRRASGAPFKRFAGKIVEHRARAGFLYEIDLEDWIGNRMAEYNKQPMIPPDTFQVENFPTLDEAYENTAIPMILGTVSDEAATTPQGVVPARYVAGPINFQTLWGGLNKDVDAYVICQGALPSGGVINVYANTSTSADTRNLLTTFGDAGDVWVPHKANWSETGLATEYVVYPTSGDDARTWTPLFVDRANPLAQAAREGGVTIAVNAKGVETVGDGSGTEITSPPRQWQWILNNLVLGRWKTGAYLTTPTFDDVEGTPMVDSASVDAVTQAMQARISGGYLSGFMLGRDGQQQALFDILGELCHGTDMEQGINRHGQLMLSCEGTTSSAIAEFDSQNDILDGAYEVWTDQSKLFNEFKHRYGYRYIEPSAPRATGTTGEPQRARIRDYGRWESRLRTREDNAAIAAIDGERISYQLDNYVLRDSATATNLEGRLLYRALGPSNDGPRWFRFTTGWQGLGSGTSAIELGSKISITHPERIGSSSTATDLGRVMKITDDLMRARITLEGYLVNVTMTEAPPPQHGGSGSDAAAAVMAAIGSGGGLLEEALYDTNQRVQPF
jgi:hypothetical protein